LIVTGSRQDQGPESSREVSGAAPEGVAEELSPRVAEYFARDDAADQWWGVTNETRGRYARQLAFLGSHLPIAGKRGLDIATGRGRFAIQMAKQGASYVMAVDISRKMVQNAEANAAKYGVSDKIDFCVANVFDLDLPDASFDVVAIMEVLVHLPRPDEALRRMAALLRPGGHLVLNFDFSGAERVTYPIDALHSVLRGLAHGRFRPHQVMYDTVEETLRKLDGEGDPGLLITRPRDAYRGLDEEKVIDWIGDAGLAVKARLREYPRALRVVPLPLAIGVMLIAVKPQEGSR
jgi:SAM-dependent methyltransferase